MPSLPQQGRKIPRLSLLILFLSLALSVPYWWMLKSLVVTTTATDSLGAEGIHQTSDFPGYFVHQATNAKNETTLKPTFDPKLPSSLPPLKLVFVGDSLSRYMYLSLTYYLKHKHWAPRGHEFLEKVKDEESNNWNEWLALTHSILQPEETYCDCYRYWQHPFKWYKHCENRYYHDDHGNYIAFLTKFGGNPFHGHVLAEDVFQTQQPQSINQTLRSYDWSYKTWEELIDDYVSKWNPKPDFFIFNSGHWKAHELREEETLMALQSALTRAGITGIYRTTTFRQDENATKVKSKSLRSHEPKICSKYFPCINMKWTADLNHSTWPNSDYVDPVHFTAPVNNRMSRQILNFVLKLQREQQQEENKEK